MTISHTFERPIDQSLFDLLKTLSELSSEAESEKVFSEAENLIARGADVNAKAVNSNIPEGRLPACIFEEWSYNPPFQKLALTRILLASGFDPGLDGGLNGALTLAHYIKLSFPNNEFLSGLKALLRAGCDPSRECLLFDDEFLPDSALSYLDDDFGDVFLIDHDFPTMLGLSAARFCLQKCIERRNYETVGLITQALKPKLPGTSKILQ
ncbi:MAG: hypothetical protein J6K46_07460 [Sutterella sp.]|nr:hypothetical protein [Sutterella sp.]